MKKAKNEKIARFQIAIIEKLKELELTNNSSYGENDTKILNFCIIAEIEEMAYKFKNEFRKDKK